MGHQHASLKITLESMAQIYRSQAATAESVVADFIGLFSDLERRFSFLEDQCMHQHT